MLGSEIGLGGEVAGKRNIKLVDPLRSGLVARITRQSLGIAKNCESLSCANVKI